MRIKADRAKCAGIGLCEALAPEVFEVGADGDVLLRVDQVDAADAQRVQAAVGGCPTGALSLTPGGS